MINLGTNAVVRVEGDDIDRAIRMLKKKVEREGLIREIKRHAYYEKPTEERRKRILKAKRKQQKIQRKINENSKYL